MWNTNSSALTPDLGWDWLRSTNTFRAANTRSVPCLDPRPRQARQSQMLNLLSARLSLDPLPWRARDHGIVPSPFWSNPPYQTQEKTQGKL